MKAKLTVFEMKFLKILTYFFISGLRKEAGEKGQGVLRIKSGKGHAGPERGSKSKPRFDGRVEIREVILFL